MGKRRNRLLPGRSSTYEFLYKPTHTPSTAEYERVGASKAPVLPAMYFGTEADFVSEEITGLIPNTHYVAAENGKGERAVANAVEFETTPHAPGARPAPAWSVFMAGAGAGLYGEGRFRREAPG